MTLNPAAVPGLHPQTPLTPDFFRALERLLLRPRWLAEVADSRYGGVDYFHRRDSLAVGPANAEGTVEVTVSNLRGWTPDGRWVEVAATETLRVSVTPQPGSRYELAVRLDPDPTPGRPHPPRHQLIVTRAAGNGPPAPMTGRLDLGGVRFGEGSRLSFVRWPAVVRFNALPPFDAAWDNWVGRLTATLVGLWTAEVVGPAAVKFRAKADDLVRDWRDLPILEVIRQARWLARLRSEPMADLVRPPRTDDAAVRLPDDPTDWPAIVAEEIAGALPACPLPDQPLVPDDMETGDAVRLPAQVRFRWDGDKLYAELLDDLSDRPGLELRLPDDIECPAVVTFEYLRGLQDKAPGVARLGAIGYPLPAPPPNARTLCVWPVPRCRPELWMLSDARSPRPLEPLMEVRK